MWQPEEEPLAVCNMLESVGKPIILRIVQLRQPISEGDIVERFRSHARALKSKFFEDAVNNSAFSDFLW